MKFEIKHPNDITVADSLSKSKGAMTYISALTGLSVAEVKALPLTTFETLKAECERAEAIVEPKDPTCFEIGGFDYGLMCDLEKFEVGAMVDIFDADETNPTEFHLAMLAALFRKVTSRIGSKYITEAYTGERPTYLLDTPLSVYKGAEVFFYRIVTELAETSLTEAEKVIKEMKTQLSINTVGSEH